MDEYRPNGASEEDAVSTILTCIWRKRRVEMYVAGKAAERQNNREQAARLALGALGLESDSIARVLRTCAPDIRDRIEQKFPRANYALESEWECRSTGIPGNGPPLRAYTARWRGGARATALRH